jgi:hypothetical protein
MRSVWTQEAEAVLMELYHAGVSCSQTSKELARRFGVRISRNAVIGKIQCVLARDNKPRFAKPAAPKVPKQAKPEPAKEPEALRYRRPSNPAPLKHFPRVQTQPSVKGVPQGPLSYDLPERKNDDAVALVDLQSHHCRYPLDDESGRTFFCGKAKQEGSSYCPEHHDRCTHKQPPVSRLFAPRKSRRFEGGRLGF